MLREVFAGAHYSGRMQVGKTLLTFGFMVMIIGALLLWAPGTLAWFGRLPGDIRIEREGFRFYCPIVSMLLVSLVLSLLVRLLGKS